jgi:hypothetical protein
VFTASPETIRRKSPEIGSPLPSRLRAGPGSLRAVESRVFLVVVAALRGGAALLFDRHKRPLPAINRQEIGHHLAGDRSGRTIGILFLSFFFIEEGQFVAVSRSQLRRFH